MENLRGSLCRRYFEQNLKFGSILSNFQGFRAILKLPLTSYGFLCGFDMEDIPKYNLGVDNEQMWMSNLVQSQIAHS